VIIHWLSLKIRRSQVIDFVRARADCFGAYAPPASASLRPAAAARRRPTRLRRVVELPTTWFEVRGREVLEDLGTYN